MTNEEALSVGRLLQAVDGLQAVAFDVVVTSLHHVEVDNPIARHVTREALQIHGRAAALSGGSQHALKFGDIAVGALPPRRSTGGEALRQLEQMAFGPVPFG